MFQHLSSSSGNAVGFRIGEDVTDEEVHEMGRILAHVSSMFGNARLLVEIEGFRHMEPGALLENMRFAVEHAGSIDRLAVLSDRVWIKSWLRAGGLPVEIPLEHFDRFQVNAAWEWARH